MNLLEQYITEIHSERIYTPSKADFPLEGEYIQVDVTTNCYGSLKRGTRIFSKDEWEQYKQQGYWLG